MEFINIVIVLLIFGHLMDISLTLAFVVRSKNLTVNANDNVTLECIADQKNIYHTWNFMTINKTPDSISELLGFCSEDKGCIVKRWHRKIRISRASRLTIYNISSIQSGFYTCEVNSMSSSDGIISVFVITVKTPPKSITIHFNKSVNVFQENEIIAIHCSVLGSIPPPKIFMYIVKEKEMKPLKLLSKNSQRVASSEFSAISLWRPHYLDDRGFIMCIASNDAGNLTKNSTLLNIKYKPKIKPFSPNIIDAMINHTIDLSCDVIANPSANVQWIIEQGLQRIDSSELITKIKPEMAGSLICQANNSIGQSNESLQLNVLRDPTIHIDSIYRVTENTDYSIECIVKSNPSPEFIKWYKLSNSTDSSAVLISDDAKLNFIRTDRSSSGMYACVTQNIQIPTSGKRRLANAEKTMLLVVTYKPGEPRIINDEIVSVMKNDKFTLMCSINHKSPGEPLPTLKWIDLETKEIISESDTFEVMSAESKHSGKYQCLAKNAVGSNLSTNIVTVIINEIPTVISQDINRKIFLSYSDLPQSIGFTCFFRGQPLYESKWRYGNEVISLLSQDYKIDIYRNISQDRAILIFTRLTIDLYSSTFSQQTSLRSSPNGRYNCEASNRHGIASQDYFLIIKYPPHIKANKRHTKIAALINQNDVKIQCQVESISITHIKWFKTNEHVPLLSFNKYSILETDISKYDPDVDLFSPGVKVSELTIKYLESYDFTNYTCVATNEQGIKKANFEVVFKTQPDSPYDLKVSDFEWDSVTISWKPGFNGGLQQSFEIVVISETFGSQKVPFYSDKEENTLTITGLFPNTPYEIKIFALNTIGRSPSSETVKCVTKRIHKFDKIQAKILSDSPKIAVVVQETDLCANLEYSRDNGHQWFSVLHCIRFNASHINETVYLDITRVTTVVDLQSGLIHLRLTFCLLSRPSVCSPHKILENPKNDNLATQTVILVIAVICFLLIIILIALFIVCCIRFRYHCVSCNQYLYCDCCCIPPFYSATNKPIRTYHNRKSFDGKPLSCSKVSCQDILDENDITTGSTSNYCSSLIGSSTPHIMNRKCCHNSSNEMYSSFICPHQEFHPQIPILYEGSSFLQPTKPPWPQKISPPSCEASSSHSHSSTGSSGRNLPQHPIHYRKKQDVISNSSMVNLKSFAQNEEKIKLPDVTSEAIHFVKPTYNEKLMEAVV